MPFYVSLPLIFGVIIVVGLAIGWNSGAADNVVARLIEPQHDKLGWMDGAEFTDADRQRVAQIAGRGFNSQEGWIGSMQSGVSSGITRRDVELLRQDRRRSRAAYPDVKELTQGAWLTADLSARIPMDWGGGNSNGTQGKDGKWYLDGGFYVGVVRSQYPNRATAAETIAYFAELKLKERIAKIARLTEDGPMVAWGGTGGSMSVRYDKATNLVTIERAKEWASTAQRWTMPFVVDEWVDINATDLDAIKKIPSFAQAVETEIQVRPSGVSISMGRGGPGVIMPGESVSVGVSVPRQ